MCRMYSQSWHLVFKKNTDKAVNVVVFVRDHVKNMKNSDLSLVLLQVPLRRFLRFYLENFEKIFCYVCYIRILQIHAADNNVSVFLNYLPFISFIHFYTYLHTYMYEYYTL